MIRARLRFVEYQEKTFHHIQIRYELHPHRGHGIPPQLSFAPASNRLQPRPNKEWSVLVVIVVAPKETLPKPSITNNAALCFELNP